MSLDHFIFLPEKRGLGNLTKIPVERMMGHFDQGKINHILINTRISKMHKRTRAVILPQYKNAIKSDKLLSLIIY
jgi:hypothetical protein